MKAADQGVVDGWKQKLATDARWATRALVRIFEKQTEDEKRQGETTHHNNVGFTALDAGILTDFATFYLSRGYLTSKQMNLLHKKMPKYAAQLMRLVQLEEAA